MNIFVLDLDPVKAAEYHNDRHCVKMILEGVQLLSTAYRSQYDNADELGLYKSTHINHPCSKWVRESGGNFRWLFELTDALSRQYTERFGKIHKSSLLLDKIDAKLFTGNLTPFALAMPDQYKQDDPVQSYRDYYKGEKAHLAKWRNGEPWWWK